MIKIGRRGSMTAYVHGDRACRATPPIRTARGTRCRAMARLMDRLAEPTLDDGTDAFRPLDACRHHLRHRQPGQQRDPGRGRATVNIRFNDAHSSDSLTDWMRAEAATVAAETGVEHRPARPGLGRKLPDPARRRCPTSSRAAVEAETGLPPVLSTTGGTSDARFVKDHCPVVEFGLVGKTMHQVDERVPVAEIRQLKAIYRRILRGLLRLTASLPQIPGSAPLTAASRLRATSRGMSTHPHQGEILTGSPTTRPRPPSATSPRPSGIKGADRIDLKRILKELEAEGQLEKRRKTYRDPDRLPPVSVLQVLAPDADGDLFAQAAGMAWRGARAAHPVVPRERRPRAGRGRPHPRPPEGGARARTTTTRAG